MLFIHGKRIGFEFKYADAPTVTKSLLLAYTDLNLGGAFVVHPGTASYPLNDWAEALAIGDLHSRLVQLVNPVARRRRLVRPKA